MKKFILLILTLTVCLGGFAQFTPGDTLKYRISLKDKAATDYSLQKPEKYLSKKSIERRKKQGLKIDSTDLPVCKKYVDAIRRKGVHILVTGKWENFVTVSCNDSVLIDEIARLPFVRSAERVWKGNMEKATRRDSLINKPLRTDSLYGPACTQVEMSKANLLHDAGFKGKGMMIAVIDAGFHNVDKIEAMKNIDIRGVRDFVNPEADIYAESSHGMSVLSCMAMNQPNVMIGTAPEASYWLLRSEDEYSENLVEQDYWAAAIEFADSVGVDLVNTSLGYYSFDDPTKNYRYRDLNGHYALMSREASHAADKGMVVVCSAGNSGAGSWKKIMGATLSEINIKEAVNVHFRDIAHDPSVHDVTYENSQARERTQILMDSANQDGSILVGTGDLSELALGWATYNGDHMSMYGVNASVPKTLVRHLVRYYADTCKDEKLTEVLLDILDTPVSPELLPPKDGKIAQKTEDLVGPYELHDFYLYYMLRAGFEPEKIYRLACETFEGMYDKETIFKWLKTLYWSFFAQQFKRSCLFRRTD